MVSVEEQEQRKAKRNGLTANDRNLSLLLKLFADQ